MRRVLLVAAVLANLPSTAAAYSHGKPGLWTLSMQMDLGQAMPNLTPEQQAMLKARGIDVGGGNTINNDVCITPEQAVQEKPTAEGTQRHCHLENLRHDGKAWDADMVCDGPVLRRGHSHVVYDSDEHYAGEVTMTRDDPRRGPQTTTSHFSGQWKGADCGGVKPYGAPK